MKKTENPFFYFFLGKIILPAVFLSVLLTPFSAFALNTDLVEDELYWIDKGTQINYAKDNYFEGFSKYIADEDEGCFYLFTRFTDYRIDKNSNENITLAFTIKNDVNTYYFQVDKDGTVNSTSQNTLNSVEIHYNFDEASCKKQGGGVYVAFKLKNNTDRTLNNSVSCEYSCGLDCTYDLLSNISLDMYVPTTAKTTTQKTAKQTTTKKNTSAAASKSSERDNAGSENSTKFSGSGMTASSGRSSSGSFAKFSADTNDIQSDSQALSGEETQIAESRDAQSKDDALEITPQNSETKLSGQAKLLIIIFAVLFVLGVICVMIGTVHSKKKDEDEEKEDAIKEENK